MDPLKQLSGPLEALAAHLGDQSKPADLIVFAVFILLCLIAMASSRFATMFGGALLAAVGCYLFLAPDSALLPLAIGAFSGSLIVSVGGILSRRREKALQRKFELLRQSVQNLEFAAERHVLQSLNPDAAPAEKLNAGD